MGPPEIRQKYDSKGLKKLKNLRYEVFQIVSTFQVMKTIKILKNSRKKILKIDVVGLSNSL